MPHYFLNVTDGGRTFPDYEGQELKDDEAAREEALATLGNIAHEKLPDGDHRMFVVDVMDADRKQILTANLSLMVTYPKPSPTTVRPFWRDPSRET